MVLALPEQTMADACVKFKVVSYIQTRPGSEKHNIEKSECEEANELSEDEEDTPPKCPAYHRMTKRICYARRFPLSCPSRSSGVSREGKSSSGMHTQRPSMLSHPSEMCLCFKTEL